MHSSANPSDTHSHRSTHQLTHRTTQHSRQDTQHLTHHGTQQTQGFRIRLDAPLPTPSHRRRHAPFNQPGSPKDQSFPQLFHRHSTPLSDARHRLYVPERTHSQRPRAAGRAIQQRTRNLPEHPYFVAPGACGPARKNNGLVKKSYAGRNHHSRPDGERRSRTKRTTREVWRTAPELWTTRLTNRRRL